MTTLLSAPVAPLLDRMYEDAETSSAAFRAGFAGMSEAQRAALMADETRYIELYTRAKDAHLPVSKETGTLLYMLARSTGAESIIEFGTSFGISTLHLAAALRDNGGGRLITCEFEPSKVERAQKTFAEAGLADLIEVRKGDALETLARDLPDTIDVVLLDGAKGLYLKILRLLEPRLRRGALIVADNADWCPDYLAHVRSTSRGYLSVPFRDDVELSMRIG